MRCWREDGDTMKGSVLYNVLHIILVVIAVLFSILLMYVIIVWGHPDTGISEDAVPILQEAHEVYSENPKTERWGILLRTHLRRMIRASIIMQKLQDWHHRIGLRLSLTRMPW